eukprot:maker-scaffold675_size187964-snap-gene-0.31 protein:Tk03278 transcript:maker-scaffold675_size187964-snap-gene-0.31-mRNA-1 annotation:"maguk p55 subfamily member 6"
MSTSSPSSLSTSSATDKLENSDHSHNNEEDEGGGTSTEEELDHGEGGTGVLQIQNGNGHSASPIDSTTALISKATILMPKMATTVNRRRESGLTRILGSMTKLLGKNLARSTDLLFLKTLTGSNSIIRQPKVTGEQEAPPSYLPVTHDSLRLIEQAKTICEQRIYLDEAKELFSLISSKWLQAVLEIHDEVAAQIQNYCEGVEYIDGVSSIEEGDEDEDLLSRLSSLPEDRDAKPEEEEEEVKVDTFRVIGVRRQAGQCLGLTVRLEGTRIKVARILIDSVIDRQGLLNTGDIILQANGKDVKNPEDLQKAIEDSGEFIVFKIMPNPCDSPTNEMEPPKFGKDKFFLRAMFDYNPGDDNLLPCQDIGLPFRHGDILEIVNWSDPSWWQARKVNSKERPGLVPSQDLEERRQCFVKNGFVAQTTCCGTTGRREKRKYEYHVRKNLDFDKAELMLYEAVEKMPPFSRKTLVLVSPHGLGKQSLIHKLVDSNPDMYGTTIPWTSRPMGDYEIDGESCWFVDHERMLDGLDNNEFLDVGEHDNYLFGTTLEAVRNVMVENKLCVLDVRPEALKLLHNSTDFLPFVIYLNPPPPDDYKKSLMNNGRASQNIELADCRAKRMAEESDQIKREFQKYFDLEFNYEDPDSTLEQIMGCLQKL